MVYFRGTTQRLAAQRGLAGWVRNLPDGRVEAVFQGARPQVEEMIAWCAAGPPSAVVERVETQWEEPQDEPGAFRVR
jgi:acylphosphatase